MPKNPYIPSIESLSDWNSFGDAFSYIPALSGTYYTVANITTTKSGILDFAYARDTSNTDDIGIRITIDGIVKYESHNAGGVQGILQELMISSDGTSTGVRRPFNIAGTAFSLSTYRSYPYTGNSAGICVLSCGIPFNSSAVIEVKNNTDATAIEFGYGGKIK